MVRAASKRFQAGERIINIGYLGEGYEREIRAFKDEIIDKNTKYQFICDHEQVDNGARYGRWVEKVDHVNGI